MNKTTTFQAVAALLATLLLYEAQWGLNAFLVTLLALLLMALTKRLPLVPALLFGLAGALVAVHASILSMVLYWILLFVLISNGSRTVSWPSSLPNGIDKLLRGAWQVLRHQRQGFLPGFSLGKSLLLTLPPLGITMIFYALYANASPTFASKVSLAQLDLPAPSWFLLFFGLLWASYALSHTLPSSRLEDWDAEQPDVLQRERRKNSLNPFWLKYEYKTALVALVCLNGLLLLFHAIDITALFEGKPGDITYSEWVHQGVGALIISIIMAVALLVYVFRGNLNFFRENESLKMGAKVWIIQNAALAFTTALKNSWYVAYWGLTYRRIGVFVYLTLVLIGLITTWSKINQKYSLWWMIKSNYKAVVLVLLLLAVFPWARIITWYNLSEARVRDEYYLFHLPIHNTDQLQPYRHTFLEQHQQALTRREASLKQATLHENWKSWNLLNHYAAQHLKTAQ